ncbi:uncharacterized protein [Chanodichthys erythropterus]|uniref:uncharacterized protein n=1 Tax=Chanodichthys erythropterus TaxID=933992 RepID=UPI00351F122F
MELPQKKSVVVELQCWIFGFLLCLYFSLTLFEDCNMQRLEDLLRDSESIDGQDFAQQPPLSSWCQRQKEVQQCWQQARPQNIDNLLSAENIFQMTCNHCHVREAIIRCGECLPSEWFCAECDQLVHKRHKLHSRQTSMYGFYKYIPPTEFVKLHDGKYIVCEQGNAASSPVDAHGLQISIEALFVSISLKKHYLYRQNDRNKRCQKISQKIAQEKKRLLEEIQRYNQQPDGDLVDTISVVQKLSNKAAESMIWPWQEQNTDGVDIITKKKLFDQCLSHD